MMSKSAPMMSRYELLMSKTKKRGVNVYILMQLC